MQSCGWPGAIARSSCMSGHSRPCPAVGPVLQCPSRKKNVPLETGGSSARTAAESPWIEVALGASRARRLAAAAWRAGASSIVTTSGKIRERATEVSPRNVPVSTARSSSRVRRSSCANPAKYEPIPNISCTSPRSALPVSTIRNARPGSGVGRRVWASPRTRPVDLRSPKRGTIGREPPARPLGEGDARNRDLELRQEMECKRRGDAVGASEDGSGWRRASR